MDSRTPPDDCAWEVGSARSGPTGVRGLIVLFNEGITKYAHSQRFRPTCRGFHPPGGPRGHLFNQKRPRRSTKERPEGVHPPDARCRVTSGDRAAAARSAAAPAAAAPAAPARRAAAAGVSAGAVTAGVTPRPPAAGAATAVGRGPARRRTAASGARLRRSTPSGDPQTGHQRSDDDHGNQHRDEDVHAPHPTFSPPKRGPPSLPRCCDRGIPPASSRQSGLEQLQSFGPGWRP